MGMGHVGIEVSKLVHGTKACHRTSNYNSKIMQNDAHILVQNYPEEHP